MSIASRMNDVLRSETSYRTIRKAERTFARLRRRMRKLHTIAGETLRQAEARAEKRRQANEPRSRNNGRRATRVSTRQAELARYYANFEIPFGSDLATVESARKRLMKKYHPDRHATDPEKQLVADELVKQINHAYEELRRHLTGRS